MARFELYAAVIEVIASDARKYELYARGEAPEEYAIRQIDQMSNSDLLLAISNALGEAEPAPAPDGEA